MSKMSTYFPPLKLHNQIIHGDCLEIFERIPEKSVDLIYADPPYNFRSGGDKSSFFTKFKKRYIQKIEQAFGHDFHPEPFLDASLPLMEKYNAYWWCSKSLIHRYINWAAEKKFLWDLLTWHKSNPPPLWNTHYLPDTEYCIFIKQPGATFNSNIKPWQKYKKYYETRAGGSYKAYPCMKPLYIVKIQIEISSNLGDIILDPFIGSGTTADACRELERTFIGIDSNLEACEISREKLKQGILKEKP